MNWNDRSLRHGNKMSDYRRLNHGFYLIVMYEVKYEDGRRPTFSEVKRDYASNERATKQICRNFVKV